MSRIDDQLRARLAHDAPPIRTDTVADAISARRRAVAARRRLGSVALVTVVVAGTLGGYLVLDRVFRPTENLATTTTSGINGPIVTVRELSSSESQLVIHTDPGVPARVLTPRDGAYVYDPAPSPDGRSVAYVHVDLASGDADVRSLMILDLETGDAVPIATGLFFDPAWSPDGSAIVVESVADGGLVVIDVGSGTRRALVAGADPAWSPDGDMVAFEVPSDRPPVRTDRQGVFVVPVEGGEPILVGPDGTSPAWSPDGSQIVYSTLSGLMTVDAAGGTPEVLRGVSPDRAPYVDQTFSYVDPGWSPDGRSLIYVTAASSRASVVIDRGDADPARVVAEGVSYAWLPEASPPLSLSRTDNPEPCRASRIDGSFGASFDSAWILEYTDGGRCTGTGPQRLAVGTADGPTVLSRDIRDIPLGDTHVALWPYATPDIDGDGIDEIAVGIGGSRGHGWATVKLFRYDDAERSLGEIAWIGDPQLDRSQPVEIGPNGGRADGVYCGPLQGGDGRTGVVSWSAGVNTPFDAVRAFLYVVDGGELRFHDSGSWETPDAPRDYPDDGLGTLCGSETFWPEDLGISPPPVDDPDSVTIPGVPFAVCRVSSISGTFGSGLNTVWVLEEENRRGEGCLGEGFQRLAIGRDGKVEAMTDRLTDVSADALWPAWTFAAPDLDGDGIDEVALGVGRWPQDPDGDRYSVSMSLWGVLDGQLVPIDCGAECENEPFIRLGQHGDEHHGAVCDRFGGRFGLLRWVVVDGTGELNGVLWILESGLLKPTDITEVRTGEASASLNDGTREFCGSATHPASEFA